MWDRGGLLQPLGQRARLRRRVCRLVRPARGDPGYFMLSAKVGTGIVAELGAMRISDEIDALG